VQWTEGVIPDEDLGAPERALRAQPLSWHPRAAGLVLTLEGVRAAARTAALSGDAYGYGPALWVAPVLHEAAAEREVSLPRGDWIEAWSGESADGGGEVVAPAPLDTLPVWVRAGSIVATYPRAHVETGLGDTPEAERPLQATLWGEPRLGHTAARLADGTRVAWRRGVWSVEGDRLVSFAERGR
jgi:hypothetical protein